MLHEFSFFGMFLVFFPQFQPKISMFFIFFKKKIGNFSQILGFLYHKFYEIYGKVDFSGTKMGFELPYKGLRTIVKSWYPKCS